MTTKIIRQSQESVHFVSSTKHAYTLRLIRTSIDGEAPAKLPIVVEEIDDDTISATYDDGLAETFQSLDHFANHHGCSLNGFDSVSPA